MGSNPVKPSELIIVSDPAAVAKCAADWIVQCYSNIAKKQDQTTIAFAGGSSPTAAYQLLSTPEYRKLIDWQKVSIYFGDERCVPPDSRDSNYGNSMRALFPDGVPFSDNVHRMDGDAEDLQAAAARYEQSLPTTIDIVMGGMGEDAHTCSLFPGLDAVSETQRKVLVVTGPKPPNPRLTITAPVIEAAANRLMLVAGKGKAEALRAAFNEPLDITKYPVQLFLNGTWIVDEAAASLID